MLILIILASVALIAGLLWLAALPFRLHNRIIVEELAS